MGVSILFPVQTCKTCKLLGQLNPIFEGSITLTEISINKRNPSKGPTSCELLPKDFEGKSIVIVDDVLNSGGTLMYAVNYFLQSPVERISTAVLIDRNHKKFPIKADIKGLSLSTSFHDKVEVDFKEPSAVYLV